MTIETLATRLAPHALSFIRILVGLLFLEHGTSKLLGFPQASATPVLLSLGWIAGALELVGGVLVTLGLFTRTAAFIISGEMAVAYFMSHAPHSFYPIINRGDSAVLYCLVFLYLAFAGAGPVSLDALWRKNTAA
jgi:putative oxidoreductase